MPRKRPTTISKLHVAMGQSATYAPQQFLMADDLRKFASEK